MDSSQHTGGFEATVRDFWATRPVRPVHDRKIAGVSAAIGRRYGVDPLLVRVAFVVAAFYSGAGITLYLLGWLLFPREVEPTSDDSSPRTEPTSGLLGVVLVLLLIPGVLWLTDSLAVLAVATGLLAIYGLHVTRGGRQTDSTTPATEGVDPVPEQGAPAWDPLGVVPQAWDLPEPPPEPAPAPRPRHRWYNPLAVLLTLLAGGAGFLAIGHWPNQREIAVVLAGMLGLAGLFLVGGALLRVGRWPILLVVPLAALTLVANLGHDRAPEFDDVTSAPRNVGELRPNYHQDTGQVDLDLRALTMGRDQSASTSVDVGAGRVLVHVPSTMDVTVRCHADLGNLDCLGRSAQGSNISETVVDDGPDGPSDGQLNLNLSANTGSVEVVRD